MKRILVLILKVKKNHMCEKNINIQSTIILIIVLMMTIMNTEIVHQVNNFIKL